MKEIFSLFLTFAKVGAMTFGGGYAMLPVLQREVVEKRSWATEEELADYFAIGQCTPGVIAVNTATFIGQKRAGVLGGIFATLGVVFPSVVIITIIAAFLNSFSSDDMFKHAFAGIRGAVCVLILSAAYKLCKKAIINKAAFAIFIVVLLLALFVDISPVFFVIPAAIAGIIIKNLEERKK